MRVGHVEVVAPAGVSVRRPPEGLRPEDHAYFAHEFTRPVPAAKLYLLRSAEVTTEGVILDGLGVFEASLAGRGLWRRSDLRYVLSTRLRQRRRELPDTCPYVLAFDSEYRGYFHWVTETLSRLFLAQHLLPECVVLLPPQLSPFHLPSLSALGDIRTLAMRSNEFISAPRLWMPGHLSASGNYNDEVLARLALMLRKAHPASPARRSGSRLYVSRRRASRRHVLNEDALLPVLAQFGFRSVCFEELPFPEQVQVARDCSCLVSIHGAGLTNMLFMSPGGAVLEFRQRGDTHNNCYFAMASALGHRYRFLLGDRPDSQPEAGSNLTIDPDALAHELGALVK